MATLCSGFGLLEGPVWDPARGLLLPMRIAAVDDPELRRVRMENFPGSDLKEGVRAFLESARANLLLTDREVKDVCIAVSTCHWRSRACRRLF